MNHSISRRELLAAALATGATGVILPREASAQAAGAGAGAKRAGTSTAGKPYRIYAITFRGMTDVERGFEDRLGVLALDARSGAFDALSVFHPFLHPRRDLPGLSRTLLLC